MFESTISLGNILTVLSFIAIGMAFIWTMKGDIRIASTRLEGIEEDIHELRKVVVEIARQEERIRQMDERLIAQGKRIDAQGDRITSLDQRLFKQEARV
jgi:septal ring factor EnvC (AmiA/AmiB activator)